MRSQTAASRSAKAVCPLPTSRTTGWIEQGESFSEACRWNWCCYRSFRLHVSRNDRYQERLKRAEEAREDFLREYHIANVRKHAPRNVIASLWWLERRYPNQFALRSVYRSEGSTDQPIGDKIDESQLRRYSEWKISGKRMKRKRLRNLSRFPRLKVASK